MSRLDVYLTENGLAKSRERAKALIKGGKVTVNGETCTQRGKKVRPGDAVSFHGVELTVAYADQ